MFYNNVLPHKLSEFQEIHTLISHSIKHNLYFQGYHSISYKDKFNVWEIICSLSNIHYLPKKGIDIY